jgi:hypothetical protein
MPSPTLGRKKTAVPLLDVAEARLCDSGYFIYLIES